MTANKPALHAHAHDDSLEGTHFSLRGYLTGFAAAALLTVVPFWIVMTKAIADAVVTAAVIIILALTQILVHTFSFLHVNARAQDGWTLVAYAFTAVLVAITIGGSLWIMYHLNLNMMPGMMSTAIDQGM